MLHEWIFKSVVHLAEPEPEDPLLLTHYGNCDKLNTLYTVSYYTGPSSNPHRDFHLE